MMVKKAQDLVERDDLASGARYLDAVLIDGKARDFFDAKDTNVQINYNTMVAVACVLMTIGRLQESLAVARLWLKSARERKDLDLEMNQQCMWNYAKASYVLQGLLKKGKKCSMSSSPYERAYRGPMPQRRKRRRRSFSVFNIST